MRFMVARTTEHSDRKPCDEAFEATYTRHDERNVTKPENIPHYKGESDWWYSEGENHRVERRHIIRDFPGATDWFVEIEDIAALMAFVEKYGDVVICEAWSSGDHGCKRLEIYDSWRE